MGRIKRFIQTASTYLVGNILSKLVSFFLIPLYTNKLSSADYGDYDVVITIITLLVSVTFFQIWDGMFRLSFDAENKDDKDEVINTSVKGYVICILPFACVYLILSRIASFAYPILTFVFGIVFALQYIYSFAARVFLRNKLFVVSGVANTLAIAITNIVMILQFGFGIRSLYYAQIIGCLIQIIIIEIRLHLIRISFNRYFNFELFKRILKFSIPLCIATISYWLLSGYTKIIINTTCGSKENGLFAIAASFSSVVVLAVNVFQFAWNETAYLMANEKNRISTYKKSLDLMFCTVWFCSGIFCSVINIIFPFFVGEEFHGSSVVIPYLMIGLAANAIAGFTGTLFMTEQQTRYIMTSTIVAAMVNIVLSRPITKAYGMIGAVLVLSFSFILLLLLRMLYIKKTMAFSISPLAVFSIITIVPSVLLYSYNAGVLSNIAYIFALLLCYYAVFKRIMWIQAGEVLKIIKKGKDL